MVAPKLWGFRPKGWLKQYLGLARLMEEEARKSDGRSVHARRLREGAKALETFVAEGLIQEMGYSVDDLIEAGFSLAAVNLVSRWDESR